MGAPRRKNLIARRRTDDDADEEPAPLDDSSSISPTDVEDDADGEGSGSEGGKNDGKPAPEKKQTGLAMPAAMADTDAMMNGLQILGKDDTATISFEDAGTESSPAEHRKKEHDEYKRRRDDDPAFVPNRGGFFMHDQRHANGVLLGRGRGRGRPFPAQQNPGDAPWAHDLHETVEPSRPALPLAPAETPEPNRTFSCSTLIGNVTVRVWLPKMKDPVVIPAVRVHQHTRLPHHRPPLRRDKPVRIALPERSPRYIFPTINRSFIFIPRAMRPNQQGFGRRGKGSFGGFSSARNSLGGSVYSPAMSRRSSLREGASPAGSIDRPVVRLPPSEMSFAGSPAPVVNLPRYPLPPKPIMAHNVASLPMHQPRPQKHVSVAELETPTALDVHPPPQQPQRPFHQQVPGADHGRRPSHPSQRGTPLSQIPESAAQAPVFPPAYPVFYPVQYPPVYYYPPPSAPPAAAAPPFVPGQPYPFVIPAPAPAETTSQPGTVAHESNGMVYYYDSSQLAAPAEEQPAFQPAFPPSGYMMPPSVYYPPS